MMQVLGQRRCQSTTLRRALTLLVRDRAQIRRHPFVLDQNLLQRLVHDGAAKGAPLLGGPVGQRQFRQPLHQIGHDVMPDDPIGATGEGHVQHDAKAFAVDVDEGKGHGWFVRFVVDEVHVGVVFHEDEGCPVFQKCVENRRCLAVLDALEATALVGKVDVFWQWPVMGQDEGDSLTVHPSSPLACFQGHYRLPDLTKLGTCSIAETRIEFTEYCSTYL